MVRGLYRVKADTEIADFQRKRSVREVSAMKNMNTVGGLVLQAAGQLPKRGITSTARRADLHVLRGDSRRLYSLLVERKKTEENL